MADDKKYFVILPGYEQGEIWDSDKWGRNAEQLYSDHADATAFTMEDAYSEGIVKSLTREEAGNEYFVYLPSTGEVQLWGAQKWLRNNADLKRDHPDVQAYRVNYYDYWYDQWQNYEKNLSALQKEQEEAIDLPDTATINPFPVDSPEHDQFEREQGTIRTKASVQKDIDRLNQQYEANPYTAAAREAQAEYEAAKANYRNTLRSQILSDWNSDVDTKAAARGVSKAAFSNPNDPNPYATAAALDAVADDGKSSYEEKEKGKRYMAATLFLDKADRIEQEHSSFGEGMSNAGMNWVESLMMEGEESAYMEIARILKHLENKLGNLNEVSAAAIESNLSKSEQALLKAYFTYETVVAEIEPEMSTAYQGGGIAGEAIKFALEFIATGGLYGAAGSAAAKPLARALAKWASGSVAKKMVAKGSLGLVKRGAGAIVQTAFQPSTFADMAKAATRIDESGHLNAGANALTAYADKVIENFSEHSGEDLLKAFGWIGNKVMDTKALSGIRSAVGNSGFGKAMSWLANSQGAQIMGNLGFQGLPVEILEEVEGALLREATGLDSKALDQMFESDNFAAMIIGFAPMTLFGAGVSAASMGMTKHNLTSSEQNLYSALSQNYTTEQIDNVVNAAMSANNPNEVAAALQPLVAGLAGGNATQEQLAALLDYGKAVASYKSMISVSEERDRSLIDAKYTEIEDNVGDFWVKMAEDIEGVRQVRVAQLNDGRTVFVTSQANEQGEFTIKDAATGQTGFAKESDIAEQQDEQGNTIRLDNTMNIDDFLNGEVMAERKSAEAKRMSDERQAQIDTMKQRLAANKQINLGTEEAPQIVLAQSTNSNGVTVVDETGNSAMLTWEQVGNAIGTPLIERSDAQVVEQEIADLLARQAERKAAMAQKNVIAPAQADKAITEAEQSIEVANPMHIPTNPDGSVDENAFWNENPEGWAEWNDQQNNDGGVDSYEQITAAKAELTARLAEVQKLQATSNPANRRQAKAEAQQISARLAKIDALEKQYAEKLQTPGQKRAAVEQAIKDRVEQWKGLTGAKFIVVENASEVKDAQAAKAMAGGAHVMAWVNGNTAYVFLPNIDSVEMLDQKFTHEVVAHIGIKQLLGEEGYKSLCEKVWTVMSPTAQRYFLAYPAVKGNPILAADEYIAHIAEKVGSGVLTMEEQSVWQKIVQFVKEMLNKILGVYAQELTEQEILNNIKLSFANLVEKQGVAQEAADQTRLSAREEIDALASELTPEEMAAVINNDLQAAQEAYAKLSASAPVVEPGESSKAFIERKRTYAEQLAAAKAEMEAKQAIVDEAARMAEEQQPEEAAAPVEEAAPRSLEPTIVETENGEAMAETDGNGSVRFSVLTYEQGGRDYLVNWLAGEKYMDQSEKDFIVATLDQQYNLAKQLGKDFPVFGAWSSAEVDVDAEGNPIMSVIKANGDYSMNLDFSLICKKRRPLNALLDVMIADRMLDMRTLNEGEIAKINKVIQRHGFEVACALCFVDSKRYRVVKVAADFADLYNDLVQSLIPAGSDIVATEYNYAGYEYINERNAEKTGRMLDSVSDAELDWTKVDEVLKGVKTPKTVEQKVAKMLRDNPEFRKLANATDFVTNLGFESVKRNNPELLKVYNAKKGTGGPKASFGDVQYLNDILKRKSFTPEKAYSVGGVRVQSFSDYMGHMFFDYMQMMAELAAKGLPAHAYTKEEAFARIFGMTGMKINMSLVPAVKADGVAPGLDAEGNYAWAVPYTDEQGNEIQGQTFPPEVAFEMQQDPRYSGNVGVIAVGVSDEHILKMLGDESIHFIIPYHKSSISGIVAKETNIDQFKDYTLTQNTKLAPTEENNSLSPKQKKKILEQKAFDFYKSLGRTHDPKATAQEYLDHCKNNGLVPKFEQFASNENYYKLLVDFNTYDFVTGEYAPQGPVKMNFPEELEALVKASVASNEVLESDLKDKVGKMAEDVKAELGETRFSANTENKSISLQNNGNSEQNEQETIGSDTNVGWEANGSGVAGNTAGIVERTRDRSDIRVFEQGLESSHGAHSHDSERARRDAESERLVDIAKKNNLYIPLKDTESLGTKVQKRTGESVVYVDKETGRVFKVKDPYAKSAMKAGVEPEDAIYEHIVHNLVFPEAPYKFVGISDKFGDVRIVLSQDYLPSVASPTKAQIAEALASKGLLPENAYSFGNDLISVTDVEGDNVLLGEDGTVYFIDPIIRFKKPVQEVIESLSAEGNVRFSARTDEQRTALFDNAKQHYGLTNNFNAAGYMLPDGSLLDFSEANDGGDPNQRSLDHRDIEGIIMDEGKEYDSRWMYIADFMNEGAIRLLPEYAGINIMQAPTAEQRKRLFDFIYKYNGEVILEIADERLNNIAYVEYDRRTSPARVLRDIDNYFNNGVIPQQETRFSASNQNQEIFVSNAAKAVEGIKMAKATPEQWLNMLEKNGGLKAAEDKWMGLSDWLKASDKKTLTKEEVLQFINENKIQIEKVHYAGEAEDDAASQHDLLEQRVNEKYKEILNGLQDIEDYDKRRLKAYYQLQDELGEFAELVALERYGVYLTFPYEDLGDYIEMADVFGVNVNLANPINETRLAYTTDGLENNHEIALTIPTIESWNKSDDVHFGDAGEGRAIAWVRFGDTYLPIKQDYVAEYEAAAANYRNLRKSLSDKYNGAALADVMTTEEKKALYEAFEKMSQANGNVLNPPMSDTKVLVIDEIQSKRHQEGREKGYAASKEDVVKATEAFQSFNRAMREKYGENVFPSKWSEEDQAEFDRLRDEHSRLAKLHNSGIPAAPFEKNWHELAMKRMLRYAAENGYDFIAWTKGDQQAERYNIGEYVSSIEAQEEIEYDGVMYKEFGFYMGDSEEALTVRVDEDGKVVHAEGHLSQAEGRPLSDLVGKEMAVQMMQLEQDDYIEGGDLKIGNEGMRGFYDKMLPSFMNKYGKKWGVKVEDINLPNLEDGLTMHSVPVTEEMKASVMEGQTMFSAIAPHQSSIDEVDQMFADWNRDPFVGELYAKVSDLAHKMNLKIKFVEPWSDAGGANILDKVKYNVDYFNSNDYAQTKAGVLLHELIHAVTVYAVVAKNSPILTQGMKDAVMQIEAIYDEIKNDPSFDGTYGVKSEKEMIAELSNPRFRQKLRAKNLLQRIVDAIKQLLGIDKGTNAEDNLEGTLEYMIENFDQNAFDIVLKANENSDYYTQFSAVTDPAKIEELESGDKIKVYRAMQLIDGKLYPPMSAKVGGQLREPIELGKWEQAEERPDLVDAKGNFKLDKGNKSSVPARYNPYIHTSYTPLNDQFASAQSRPNLVTVEVEIPASELTSGYKAEGAKDAVGELEWPAGVVQKKLTGTRTVVLSRWDKPVRIVPDSEVAAEIVKMFDGKDITMPSNVVTPSLRAELEKLGVPFVETDNNGKPKAATLFSALPTKNDFEVEKKAMLGISMMHGFVPFEEMGNTFRSLIKEREAMVQRLSSKANKTAYDNERLARLEQDLEAAYRQLEWWENVQADLVPTDEVQPEVSKDMEPQSFEEYLSQFFTMSKSKTETKTITGEDGKKKTVRLGGKKMGVMLTPETLTSEMGWKSGDWAGIRYIVSAKDGISLDAIAEMIAEDEDAKQFLGNMDTMDIKNAVMDFLQSVGTYAEIRDYVKHQREAAAQSEAQYINGRIQQRVERVEAETGMSVDEFNARVIEDAFKSAEENLNMLETLEIYGNFEELTEEEYERYIEAVIRSEQGRVYEGNEDFEGEQSGHVLPANEWSSENDEERIDDDIQRGDSSSEGDRGGEAGGVGQPSIGHSKPGVVSDRLETEGLSVEEIVETGKQKVAAENADAADVFMQKLRKINEKLSGLRSALAAQREYDQNTVKILTSLANDLLEGGKLTDMTRGEIKRLLSIIKDATGKSDLSVSVDRLMDIMIANQLRFAKNRFADLLKIKASKVNASGVEAQGKLDVQGQQIMQSLKDAMKASEEVLNDWIAEAENDLDSDSDAVRHNAELKLAGYELARQYKEDIEASETEEAALREDLKKTEHEGKLTKEQLKEYRKTIYDAVRENKMARVNSYEAMLESLSSMLAGSVARAVAFREAETQRVENIHHMANSDMQGMPADEHNKKDSWFWNSSLVRFLFKPLATFDQMLRAFAPKSRSGEGYLWNHFMGGWLKATENEYKGIQDAHDRLDAYVRYNFGIQRWSDLFALERKLPKAEVTWWNAGKMETFEVSQGNLLYIYMINKMADGRMKLRKMGITEDDVDNIIRSIDPRFLDLADWIQERFLPSLREKYNDVHERLFGAPMAAIDNYFPIRVLANARAREVDLGVDESNAKPSTITGNIIKRTKNSLALDILGSDAFDVVLGHIEEMEKWAAFAEWNKDLNTLLSYKKFRNRVQNMAGIYGAGNVVWNNFRSAAEIAAGVYKPATKNDSVDKAIMNIAKGVTGAKISFRVYTAFKQLLSWPAFLSDARTDILAKNMANPFGAWKWSMENLPLFEKRWKSRQAGDSRLMETESDWKIWKTKAVEIAGRLGMTPNAFVDAVTVAIGARSIYETRLKKYLDYGYSQEVAEEKAKRDATVLFNESQQSNESAFLSQIQVDRTVASVVFTVFRNSSMGYQRMYVDAIRNIGRMMKPGYKGESVEYMTKQMVRDGLTPEQAERAANRIYNRSFAKNAMQALTFGFIVQLAWNLGPYLPYIFGGDDDEKKEEMVKDAIVRALVGGPVEGLAGGNIISNAAGNLAMGESLSKVSGAQLPLASDIENTFRLFGNDNVRAYNDLFNLAVQSFVGVNPQTISDIVVAVVDACNGDLETSTEAMLCIMRILQVPQSQIENFYIDEIDFKADEAYDMTVKEFAERYAKYKVMRNAPIGKALNLYTDEKEKELEEKQIKTFTQKAKEERKRRGSEEAKAWYQYVEGSEYKEMDQTLKDIREQIEAEAHAGRFDSDIIRAAQQKMMDLQQTPAFQKYMDAKMIKSQTDKLKEAPDWVDVSELKKLRKEKFDKVFKESNSVE